MVRLEPFGAVSNGLEQLSPGLTCSTLPPGVSARDMGHGGAGATPDEAADWATERARWTFGRHTATKVLGRGAVEPSRLTPCSDLYCLHFGERCR